ncbi:MAG TPA: hypothetical protein VFV95_05420 [Vicinamibacterales bacterium]|nr:hypothetical protein [Vicinamibacterales bacterium]
MSLFGSLARDLRHALRLFARSPGFVAIAVLSIGFGLAMSAATIRLLQQLIVLERLPTSGVS